MIKQINKNIDVKALEARLSEEIEEKLEFGCWIGNSPCSGACNVYGDVDVPVTACLYNRTC